MGKSKTGQCIELCIELVTGISEGDPTSGLCASGGLDAAGAQRFPEAGFEQIGRDSQRIEMIRQVG